MKCIRINEREYYQKSYGAWLGKNIGGTLGEPVEGEMKQLELTFYPELPSEFDTSDIDSYPDVTDNGEPTPLANDDLDLQLIWLHALEQYGVGVTSTELGQEWVDHVFYPYNEYRFALGNLRRGLIPPTAGWFNNQFYNDCMGSPIRSEIWALVAPAAPDLAVQYAYEDAIVDHAGGEGVYGEMFNTALESAAFVVDDPFDLIDIGLSYIPHDCNVAAAVRDTVRWYEDGLTWETTREKILDTYGHQDMTNAPQNFGFVVLGWLYGEDFGDALLKCVNCGYDTDSTGATLGSILGLLCGKDEIPEKWVEPIGHAVVTRPQVKGFPEPNDLEELTNRTLSMARKILATHDLPVRIEAEESTAIPKRHVESFTDPNSRIDPRPLWEKSPRINTYLLPRGSRTGQTLSVSIDYGHNGPAIGKSQTKELHITVENVSSESWRGRLDLDVPDGWSGPDVQPYDLTPGEKLEWVPRIRSGDEMEPSYELRLDIHRTHDGSPWSTETVDFSLVAATHWQIEGPNMPVTDVIFPDNHLSVSKAVDTIEPGTYTARTTLINFRKQELAVEIRTAAGVTATLNGDVIVDRGATNDLDMLASERRYYGSDDGVVLPAGEHELVVELISDGGDQFGAYVIPAATGNTEYPGAYYFLTDVLFG